MYTSGTSAIIKGERSASPVMAQMSSSAELSPRRRTATAGGQTTRENKPIARKASIGGDLNQPVLFAVPQLPHLPPPLSATTTQFSPIQRSHSNLDDESTWNNGHSRSKSTDAKELARIKKSSEAAASSSPKTMTKRTSIFGKKKSVDMATVEEGPSSGPPLHLPPTLPPMPEGMHMPLDGRLSLRPAPAFLAALDSSMMRRSSYVQLVDKGIVREWNDSPALDSDMIAALPPPSLPSTNKPATQGRLHSSGVFQTPIPTFWNGSPPIASVMVQPSGSDGGWHVERGSADFVEGAYNALEDDHSSPYFKIYFNGKDHTNYWGVDPRVGPVLVSVAPTGSSSSKTGIETVATFRSSARLVMNTHKKFSFNSESRNIVVHRCLIQSKLGSKQVFVRSAVDKNSLFKGLGLACGPMGYLPEIQDMKFQKSVIDITDDLLRMERSHFSFDYKFGVLYYKKNQGENEMFSNSTSPELEKFLNFLGDRITLKGWPGFTGGLDVKNDTTGTHSVFTLFRDLNVMFHVCTLLPYNPKDPQQLERKRHIGNDIVVVVFVEPGATFDPCMMKTQFNHIYAVVSMDPGDQTVRLEFAVKQGVRPFGPQLLANQRFSLDASFREFFFSKLINSERSALKANVFAAKLEHTRLRMIESIVEKLQKTK